MTGPWIKDDDARTISASVDGKHVRSWEYQDEAERRLKMLMAREFAEGWYRAAARIAELEAELAGFRENRGYVMGWLEGHNNGRALGKAEGKSK